MSQIELASQLNGGRKVALLSVSWGPQAALGFLHRMTQEWKDQYIAWYVIQHPPYLSLHVAPFISNPFGRYVAESPLYAGSPVGVLAVTSGYATDPTQPASAAFVRSLAMQIDVMMNLLPRVGKVTYADAIKCYMCPLTGCRYNQRDVVS